MTAPDYVSRAKALLRSNTYRIIDGVIARLPVRPSSGDVLVVRLDAIGDFVLWQRAAVHLRALYPGKRIVLAANATWAALARELRLWDEVLAIETSRLLGDSAYRWKVFYRIRQHGFSVALQPTYSRACFLGDSLVRISGAAQRIGADGDLSNLSHQEKRIADGWYTKIISMEDSGPTEIEHNHQFLRGLGWTERTPRAYHLPQAATLKPTMRFDRPYFIVFPGASSSGRRWPEESFARLIDAICESREWLVVLCGIAEERSICADVASRTSRDLVNLAGQTSLAEFCEVVRGAQLLVGNETSAVHIAAAVGTPSVCLLGGGHFGRFIPYPPMTAGPSPIAVYEPMDCFGCNWHCRLPHVKDRAFPCVASITVAAACAAVERVLSSASCEASAQSLSGP